MDGDGNVKIADFGLAGITSPLDAKLTLQCGTPEFTAPEIIQGDALVQHARPSDLLLACLS